MASNRPYRRARRATNRHPSLIGDGVDGTASPGPWRDRPAAAILCSEVRCCLLLTGSVGSVVGAAAMYAELLYLRLISCLLSPQAWPAWTAGRCLRALGLVHLLPERKPHA
jgi:hypothetical protein